MKIMSSRLLILILLLVSTLSYAAAEDASRQADHDMLRALRAKLTTALNNRDVESLASCFAKEFAITGVDQTVITTQDQLREYFSRVFEKPDSLLVSMKAEPVATILTRFISENIGVCYGTSTDTYTLRAGRVAVMNSKWTATLIKENGEWRIVAAHAGTDILDNPILSRIISTGYMLAGVGFGGGVILGIVFMIVTRRLKRKNG